MPECGEFPAIPRGNSPYAKPQCLKLSASM
jgi:hypothetical protein